MIRNAGGRVADALRSIIISQQLLATREIVIVHHVCGSAWYSWKGGPDCLKKVILTDILDNSRLIVGCSHLLMR